MKRYQRTFRKKIAAKLTVRSIAQAILAIGGLGMFIFLVRDVDFSQLDAATLETLPQFALLILALAFINYYFDTLSWWMVRGDKPVSIWLLMSIRARCEAITNIIPGGALIGEPMKIGFLLRSTSMTRTEATTSFLLSKFALIVGQTFYVLSGLAISYSVINRTSEELFGTENFATWVLIAAMGIFILLVAILGAMIWFQPMVRWFSTTNKQGKLHSLWNTIVDELHNIEKLIAAETRKRGGKLALAVLFACIAWSLNGVELYLILHWLGFDTWLAQGYAIDAVSAVVRMVVFMIPIGIGGQDWAISGLIAAYGYRDPVGVAAQVVVLKRAREFFVIGLGLLLLVIMPKGTSPDEEEKVAPDLPVAK